MKKLTTTLVLSMSKGLSSVQIANIKENGKWQ